MRSRIGLAALLLLALAAAAPSASAGTQNFYYDPVGRLMGETQTAGDIRLGQTDKADNPQYLKVVPLTGPSAVDTLCSFCELISGQSITSTDGRFEAVVQADGNFVVYQNSNHAALWSSSTYGHQPGYLIEYSGNLLMFAADYTVLWQTNTAISANTKLVMQTDGNLVLFSGTTVLWSSGTGGH